MNLIIMLSLFLSLSYAGNIFVGGVNLANVSPNSEQEVDPNIKVGVTVSAENISGNLRVGIGYTQRGYTMKESIDGILAMGATTLNYLNIYTLYTYSIQNNLSVFGGIQGGLGLGGKFEMEMEFDGVSMDFDDDIESDDMSFDYGVLVGGDYMINDKMGMRCSYYHGFANIIEDQDSDDNLRNTGVQLALLYKL